MPYHIASEEETKRAYERMKGIPCLYWFLTPLYTESEVCAWPLCGKKAKFKHVEHYGEDTMIGYFCENCAIVESCECLERSGIKL